MVCKINIAAPILQIKRIRLVMSDVKHLLQSHVLNKQVEFYTQSIPSVSLLLCPCCHLWHLPQVTTYDGCTMNIGSVSLRYIPSSQGLVTQNF